MFDLYAQIRDIFIMLPALIIGLTFHEFAHAFAATRLGDSTPRDQGRLTLNPLAHIDLMGFLCFILVHFGWGRPVEINLNNFKKPVRDDIIVSLAGPFMNVLLTLVFLIIYKIISIYFSFVLENQVLSMVLQYIIVFNAIFAVFNLLPIPPLDGGHLLLHAIPNRFMTFKVALYQYGSFILLGFLLLSFTFNFNFIGNMANSLISLLGRVIGI
jgi:Zn-dependent protease